MTTELRYLVRSVIAEVLTGEGDLVGGAPEVGARLGKRVDGERKQIVEEVAIATDEDLHQFACRLLNLEMDARVRREVLSGARRFRLARVPSESRITSDATKQMRFERGAVTERHVKQAVETGRGLLLGRRAVLTPLARDLARARGVTIEREGE